MQITLSVSPSFTPILSHALFHSISPSRSLCSLMFYLISHNKASLWTAINCVWIFPLRRNRELSERAPVPQAAFILMQRSIAIFIAGSITHVTVVLWLGPLHRKKPDNITAEVCKTIQLWSPRRVEGALGEAFRKQEGDEFRFCELSHTCSGTHLSALQLWEPLVLSFGPGKSYRKQGEDHRMLSNHVVSCVALVVDAKSSWCPSSSTLLVVCSLRFCVGPPSKNTVNKGAKKGENKMLSLFLLLHYCPKDNPQSPVKHFNPTPTYRSVNRTPLYHTGDLYCPSPRAQGYFFLMLLPSFTCLHIHTQLLSHYTWTETLLLH